MSEKNNNTITSLANGANYTGKWDLWGNSGVTNLGSGFLNVSIYSDQNTLVSIQQSNDTINIATNSNSTYSANANDIVITEAFKARYYRIYIENTSANAQTSLRVFTNETSQPETTNVYAGEFSTLINLSNINIPLNSVNTSITAITTAVDGANININNANTSITNINTTLLNGIDVNNNAFSNLVNLANLDITLSAVTTAITAINTTLNGTINVVDINSSGGEISNVFLPNLASLSNLNVTLSSVNTSITAITTAVDGANISINNANTSIANVNTTLLNGIDVNNNAFSNLVNLANLDITLSAVNTSITAITTAVDGANISINNANTSIANVNTTLLNGIDVNNNAFSNLASLSNLNVTLSSVTTAINEITTVLNNTINTTDTTTHSKLTTIDGSLADIDDRLADINTNATITHTNLGTINTTLSGTLDVCPMLCRPLLVATIFNTTSGTTAVNVLDGALKLVGFSYAHSDNQGCLSFYDVAAAGTAPTSASSALFSVAATTSVLSSPTFPTSSYINFENGLWIRINHNIDPSNTTNEAGTVTLYYER